MQRWIPTSQIASAGAALVAAKEGEEAVRAIGEESWTRPDRIFKALRRRSAFPPRVEFGGATDAERCTLDSIT